MMKRILALLLLLPSISFADNMMVCGDSLWGNWKDVYPRHPIHSMTAAPPTSVATGGAIVGNWDDTGQAGVLGVGALNKYIRSDARFVVVAISYNDAAILYLHTSIAAMVTAYKNFIQDELIDERGIAPENIIYLTDFPKLKSTHETGSVAACIAGGAAECVAAGNLVLGQFYAALKPVVLGMGCKWADHWAWVKSSYPNTDDYVHLISQDGIHAANNNAIFAHRVMDLIAAEMDMATPQKGAYCQGGAYTQ